jgi:hypothetical protein
MPRRIVVIACLAAGIYLLAGLGWALLTLGILVEVAWPHEASSRPSWWPKVAERAQSAMVVVRQVPRRAAAVGTMGVGGLVVPGGVYLLGGVGAAVLTAGVLLVVASLLLGWNA